MALTSGSGHNHQHGDHGFLYDGIWVDMG